MGTDSQDNDDLRLFHTGEHACGYWPERIARDLVLDPRDPRLRQWYPHALAWGFRRSGDIVYRPHCAGSTRISTEAFCARQRRWLRSGTKRSTGMRTATQAWQPAQCGR